MLDLEEAQSRLLQNVHILNSERVSLEQSLARVLAEDIYTTSPLPAFDFSAMDGYATQAAPNTTERCVIGESRAGFPFKKTLRENEAVRIFTGAPIPFGADAVVMQEHVTRENDVIHLTRTLEKGQCIRRAGEDLQQGALALKQGTRIRPAHMPLLAACEIIRPKVVRKPRVAIVATGDELKEIGSLSKASEGAILETASLGIAAYAQQAGADTLVFPIVRDNPDDLRNAFEHAFESSDVLISIGGVSVGDYDLVKEALLNAGATLDFWRVAIKPGKPIVVGRKNKTYVLGLPGNPVSALITFLLFGIPLIRALAGELSPFLQRRLATLSQAIVHQPGRTEFVRATLSYCQNKLIATPLNLQASGSVVSMAWADALIQVPKEAHSLDANTQVEIFELSNV